ncbi:MAG: hypothetical protein JWN01_41 [Patescibacteria group bacterium]|nr:hypothetical protein [Patescibacteria group bacterium]
MLPVRDDSYKSNAYLAVIPQPMIMHKKVSKMLEDYAWRLFRHYPVENSLARREHGVPMLIGRFDVIVDQNGGVQICELDDVCSLWPAMAQINPITETYLRALEHQLGQSIYTAELFQYADWPLDASPRVRKEFCRIWFFEDDGKRIPAYVPRADSFRMAILKNDGLNWRRSQSNTDRNAEYYERILQRFYLHNEDHWRGDINDAWLLKGEKFRLDEVALSVRAHRGMPGFQEHMDRYGSRSITMAWERDSKWSLVAEKLAVLAADLEVAVAFAKEWQADHPDALLVFKTLYGARTEGTAIFSSKGTKLKGVSSASQIRRKFGDAAQEPIVIQPYKEPDHLATAKVNFIGAAEENDRDIYTDRSLIRSVEHMGSSSPGERVVAGMESHFPMIFRSFVVYLPHEKRLVNIGGLWQATDGRIVHGGAHSVAGPLYVDGLVGHPDGRRSVGLDQAEAMIRSKYLELVG